MQATRWDMKPPSYTPEGWGAYGQGYADGHREARTEAFAAIRRAAELARQLDDCNTDECKIRQAIRAAIGSDKT
jgi:hypothetical protein